MAEFSQSTNTIPSNEEIIEEVMEEVMKGVEDCLIKNSKEDAGYNTVKNIESNIGCSNLSKSEESNSVNVSNKSNDTEHCMSPLTDDKNDECDNKVCEDEDFIDEVHLKDIEENLTDEEKEGRRKEAESHKVEGNDHFKMGEYRESIRSYTLGLRTCPLGFPKERAIMYSNRAAARMKLILKEDAIEDCTKAIDLDASYLKARFRRAQLYEETDKLDEALADYQEILKLDPLHREALYATKRLPEKIHERNEKMKTEMFAKLKDLGNMILRPFNLSTDNFQVNQDPNTGGYSINFKPNSS